MRLSNKRFPDRKSAAALAAAALFCLVPSQAIAASKMVYRVDSVSVTNEDGRMHIEARGAVRTGGWSEPRLVVKSSNNAILVLELRANPPSSDDMVVQMLMPVSASLSIRATGNIASVQVVSETNSVSDKVGK